MSLSKPNPRPGKDIFDLPPELRNWVYESYLLHHTATVFIRLQKVETIHHDLLAGFSKTIKYSVRGDLANNVHHSPYMPPIQPYPPATPLFLAHRQIYEEAKTIVYTNRVFLMMCPSATECFSRHYTSTVANITHPQVRLGNTDYNGSKAMLSIGKNATKLKRLAFTIPPTRSNAHEATVAAMCYDDIAAFVMASAPDASLSDAARRAAWAKVHIYDEYHNIIMHRTDPTTAAFRDARQARASKEAALTAVLEEMLIRKKVLLCRMTYIGSSVVALSEAPFRNRVVVGSQKDKNGAFVAVTAAAGLQVTTVTVVPVPSVVQPEYFRLRTV